MNEQKQQGISAALMNGGMTSSQSQMQIVNQQPPRCECHECTQARWKMFAGGGLAQMGRL